MHSKFVVDRQGRDFVLFPGLLDLAHSKGLSGIITQLEQIGTEENRWTTIFSATVSMIDPVCGHDSQKIFKSYGDANPSNTAANIQPHMMRLAETRAIARALRNAVNIGMVCTDELGDDGEVKPRRQERQQRQQTDQNRSYGTSRTNSAPAPEAGSYAAKTAKQESLVTDPNAILPGQVVALRKLREQLILIGSGVPDMDIEAMTRAQAMIEIPSLQRRLDDIKKGVTA